MWDTPEESIDDLVRASGDAVLLWSCTTFSKGHGILEDNGRFFHQSSCPQDFCLVSGSYTVVRKPDLEIYEADRGDVCSVMILAT